MKYDQAYVDKLWEVDKFKAEQYNKEVERSWQFALEGYKLDRQGQIEEGKFKLQSAKDRITFARDTTNLITNSPAYKEYDETRTRAASSREAWDLYEADAVDRSVVAIALTKNFEKIMDPTSVVRQGEFEMTENMQPYFSLKGWMGLKQKLTEGGTGITDDVMHDLVEMADAFTRVKLKQVQEGSGPLLWQVSEYNKLLGDSPITTDMIMPRGLPIGDWDSYGQSAAGYYGGEEIQAPTFDHKNTENVPRVNASVQTTVGAGIITGFGSAASSREIQDNPFALRWEEQ